MSKKLDKKLKVKKKDTLKVFSILSGLLFVLIAITSIFSGLIESLYAILWGYGFNLLGVLFDGVAFFGVVLMLVLALVLFINKNSSAVFVPLGLLSFAFIDPIVNSVIDLFASFLWGWQYSTSLVDFISFLISFAIALVITLFMTVAAFTFCKKHKQILAFIMFALYLFCGVGIGLLILLTFLLNSNLIINILLSLGSVHIWVYLFKFVLAPIGAGLLYGAQVFAVLLLAVGMCSKPRVIAPLVEEATEEYTEGNAEEIHVEEEYGEYAPEEASELVDREVEAPVENPKAKKAKAKKESVENAEPEEQADDDVAALNASMPKTLI